MKTSKTGFWKSIALQFRELTERTDYGKDFRIYGKVCICFIAEVKLHTLFEINTWGWGREGRERRALLFEVDKDALRFAERDKNHPGMFRTESQSFYPRGCLREERAVLMSGG